MRRPLSEISFNALLRNPTRRCKPQGDPRISHGNPDRPHPPSLARRMGLAALVIAGPLWLVHWRLSLIVLSTYALMCAMAPFFHRIGFFAPVIYKGRSGSRAVALTFDDGPDPLSTPALLELLKAHRVPATFFVSGCKVTRHPRLVDAILQHGHTIGNHSYHHDPLAYFKGGRAVRKEIEATQAVLKPFGVVPRAYRPPVGIVGPGLRQPLLDGGLRIVNFSCRAFDRGNKRIPGLAARILRQVQSDDIILLHDSLPLGESSRRAWLREMETLLSGLSRRGLSVWPLQKLIGGPVMDFTDTKRHRCLLIADCEHEHEGQL
jgi:peptidoglycan/xylan/chitin deacetylase (PgdA/CDA1 family)